EFKSFCRMNGFKCTFHDLRHTFASMMIAGGTDVRTVASYLGHSNVAMTLNTYAEVDPDAKRAAVGKVDDAFDIDLEGIFKEPEPPALALEFTVEQLELMLAEARRREEGTA
ncbi:MAG: tyrosine-type recombinase/integrase, partial [Eggerthellaceae bacterium]|nr:tyrosine-type recombinase/integrase [Eggerthellaceae bacterium]